MIKQSDIILQFVSAYFYSALSQKLIRGAQDLIFLHKTMTDKVVFNRWQNRGIESRRSMLHCGEYSTGNDKINLVWRCQLGYLPAYLWSVAAQCWEFRGRGTFCPHSHRAEPCFFRGGPDGMERASHGDAPDPQNSH